MTAYKKNATIDALAEFPKIADTGEQLSRRPAGGRRTRPAPRQEVIRLNASLGNVEKIASDPVAPSRIPGRRLEVRGLTMLGTFTDLLTNEEANEHVAEFVRNKINDVVTDPIIAEKLKPRGYPIFARRPCLDTGYYETFNQAKVHLIDCVTDPIVEITTRGVRTRSLS
jgi:cation diffusion facilitator CzcD-associated flavoprotein CzcO